MQMYWTPEPERPDGASSWLPTTRLGRCLAFSSAAHAVAAVAAVWMSLSLLPPPDDMLVVRTIDFVEPPAAPRASAPPRGTPKADASAGGPTVPAPASARVASAPRAAPAPAGRPASAPAAPKTPAVKAEAPKAAPPAPKSESTPKSEPATTLKPETTAPVAKADGDLPTPAPPPAPPTPSPEEQRIASAMPKSVGGGSTASRGPTSVAVPSRDTSAPSASGTPGAVAVIAPGVEGGTGPVATVSVPRDLVRPAAGTGTGSGAGAGGSGVGSGTGGAGAADGTAGGRGGGTGTVDMRDPDFSEYFRLIERRVRESWKFPESLGGTTQTVKIGFALGPEGSLRDVKVVSSSSGTLNESALAAMKRAAPFPPLPEKFRKLAGQPLVLSFTVTIK